MKALFLLSFLANIVLTLVSLLVSPEEVATHFGTGGAADGWGTRTTNALVMTGVHLLILASFGCTPLLLRKTPDRWINLPHKDYWLRPENRDRVEGMIMAPLYQFGAATFAFMFAIGLLALQANLSPPPVLREECSAN